MVEDDDIIAHIIKTDITIVKRCFVSTISPKLTPRQKDRLLKYVDDCTELASRVARRASLAFLYFVTKWNEAGLVMPDFEKVDDSYWAAWLKVGLTEFGASAMPSSPCSEADRPNELRIFDEINNIFRATLRQGQPAMEVPLYFDRVLGHLAIQFKTSILNAQKVHFFDKFERLCRHEADLYNDEDVKGFKVFQAFLSNSVPEAWPGDLKAFIADARNKIGLGNNLKIEENTDINMPSRFAFGWWMQHRFASLGRRKTMLCPVYDVKRMHVRFDATHLSMISHMIFCGKEAKEDIEKDIGVIPEPAKVEIRKGAEWKEYKRLSAERKSQIEEVNIKLDKLKLLYPSYSQLTKDHPKDPVAKLAKEHPLELIGKKPIEMEKAVWEVERMARRAKRDATLEAREQIRQSHIYKKAVGDYAVYVSKVHSASLVLFKPLKDRNVKLGWKPSASVVTDGTMISVQYERSVIVKQKSSEGQDQERKTKADQKKAIKDALVELPPCDDYDPWTSTFAGSKLVIGVDPGRTIIVTMVLIDRNNKKHVWKLSRGQYHSDSGILKENRRQAKRYEKLQQDFASLRGALKASSSTELMAYINTSQRFEERWWSEVALKRVESRARAKRFIGKQKTMNGFMSKVRKEAEKLLLPGETIDVAYGAATKSMACTGKGELAVPTKGAFDVCKRIFEETRNGMKHSVGFVCEDNTSKICYKTGTPYEKVFKRFIDGKETLDHTAAKSPPKIEPADKIFVEKIRTSIKEKGNKRRGGNGVVVKAPRFPEVALNEIMLKRKEYREARYDVCRGLLFSPELRMYFARDEASAEAIAGLRCIELSGKGRPTFFSKKKPALQSSPALQSATNSSLGNRRRHVETTKIRTKRV